jgi:hypothetical protein
MKTKAPPKGPKPLNVILRLLPLLSNADFNRLRKEMNHLGIKRGLQLPKAKTTLTKSPEVIGLCPSLAGAVIKICREKEL